MEHKGALKIASPLEIPHGMWLAMKRDLGSGEDVLQEWLTQASSCAVTFKVIDDAADILMYQDNQREQLIAIGKVVNHTGFQRIMKVGSSMCVDEGVIAVSAIKLQHHTHRCGP